MPGQHSRFLATKVGVPVGKRTLPKSATLNRGLSIKGNIPARRYWHQGFGVITTGGAEAVPFVERATAERIAGRAAEATGLTMKVSKADGMWVYRVVA